MPLRPVNATGDALRANILPESNLQNNTPIAVIESHNNTTDRQAQTINFPVNEPTQSLSNPPENS